MQIRPPGQVAPLDADRLPNGNTLITDVGKWNRATNEFYDSRVIEVDKNKNIVWEFRSNQAMEADRLPNGNTLIVHGSGVWGKRAAIYKVIEVDKDKNIVWEFSNVNSFDADRLENGNTLIADYSVNNRIIEVTPAKDIIWQWRVTWPWAVAEVQLIK